MPRQDDPALCGELILLRRIPPWADRVQWDEAGNPIPSSQNFRDKENELSVYLAHETTYDAVLEGHDGFGLVQLTAQQVRDAFAQFTKPVVICRHEEESDKGHVVICGKPGGGVSNRLKQVCKWVEGRWPQKLPPVS